MRTPALAHRVSVPVLVLLLFFLLAESAAAQTRPVLAGSTLSPGFDMGVNSSGGRTGWLENEGADMKMSYPAGQSWGAVFITVGKPKQPPRPSQDFSTFDTLSVEMRGESGGEQLEIGLKTNDQADDGSETKKTLELTSEWKTHDIPLEEFAGTDLQKLYVVAEFVFSGPERQTVYLRNVRYSNASTRETQPPPRAVPRSSTTRQTARPATITTQPPPPVAPLLNISYPPDGSTISIKSGMRPSISAQGTVGPIPAGWTLYLIVHPTRSDNVWASATTLAGEEWFGQAYLGGPDGLPNDDEMFEVFAALSDNPLPSVFNMNDVPLQSRTKPVRVIVKEAPPWWRWLAGFVPIGVAIIGAAAVWWQRSRKATGPTSEDD